MSVFGRNDSTLHIFMHETYPSETEQSLELKQQWCTSGDRTETARAIWILRTSIRRRLFSFSPRQRTTGLKRFRRTNNGVCLCV